jgi:GT2 family glycosyltransferase
VPTIGRAAQLQACLDSIARCDPPAAELLVVDQSGSEDTARVVAEAGARLVRSHERGVGTATNRGLREAAHETVMVTHDDCTVARDWVLAGSRLVSEDRDAIFTGRVLPMGDPRAVPSIIDDPLPRDYTGERHCGALFPNNMVLNRSLALELGGFDDRVLFAEDNDFCYRWLQEGRRLRYEPSLVVWHHDWRKPSELEHLYRNYSRGQGRFYAKHLRSRDRAMLAFLLRDLYWAGESEIVAIVRRRPGWSNPRPRVWRGLLPGLLAGWREFGRN